MRFATFADLHCFDCHHSPLPASLAQAVKALMVVAIYLTYPLQMYVPFQLLTPSVTRPFSDPRKKRVAEYVLRTLLVLLTCELGQREVIKGLRA